jgi:hypothetical protein
MTAASLARWFALAPLALIAGCASPSGPPIIGHRPAAERTTAPLGEAVGVGTVTAIPLEVIEDSRCPENARCAWAGHLVVRTRLGTHEWSETVDLTLGEPHLTHGIVIALVSGSPEKQADRETPPAAYRFAFEQVRQLAAARLGERVQVDGPAVTPLEVLEDSRCPADAQCVWAGRLRLLATIHLGAGDQRRELVLGEPVQVADGELELMEAWPRSVAGGAIAPADYRFTLRFDGGL